MNPVQQSLLLLVRLYRWVGSPMKRFLLGPGAACRFVPSCSSYAFEAITRHGACRGSTLAIARICRCHPWGGCGHDPVPELPASRPVPDSAARSLNFSN